jgi:hypothetical protein
MIRCRPRPFGLAGPLLLLATACIGDPGPATDADADAGASLDAAGAASGAGGRADTGPPGGGAVADAGNGPGGSPVLVAEPARLSFLDGVSTRTLTLSNVGGGVVEFRQVVLRGDATFVPLIMGLDVRRTPESLSDPDADGQPGLSAGRRFDLEVRHLPDGPGRDLATLVFVLGEGAPLEVPLANDAPEACLVATPASLSWQTRVGRPDSRTVSLAPCFADIPVPIDTLTLEGEHAAAFRIARPAPGPLVVESNTEVDVELTPDAPAPRFATLVARSTFEGRVFETRVPLEGQGVENACPVALTPSPVIAAAVGDIVRLDGGPSFDNDGPNGRPVTYEWVVLDRPEGSTSQPRERVDRNDPAIGTADDPSTPVSEFFVDFAGVYLAELRVTDDEGQTSGACSPPRSAQVTIDARPPAPTPDAGATDAGPPDAAP